MGESEMTRPVRCFFCGKPMYYRGDSRFEPEVYCTMSTRDSAGETDAEFYAHRACWESRMKIEAPPIAEADRRKGKS